ncbi:hypothetical protein ACLGIH_02330 [Streptomyces sp. HMX87]|uniref:hypothetical protein n=1 Tax=Streptomyces sp. HMX87 TaxID=3390849 RepID=UPI003A88371B
MEPPPQLPDTLRRLEAIIEERGLNRSRLLDPQQLATRTALPVATVRTLLAGGTAPPETVNDRVCARIKAVAAEHRARTGRRMSDLAAEIRTRLGVSDYWARQVCDGKKVPSVEFLHGLVEFFGVEAGEAFFTADAPQALNRALLPLLRELQGAGTGSAQVPAAGATQTLDEVLQRFRGLDEQEQLQALMRQFGVDPQALAFRGTGQPSAGRLAALLILALKDDE